MYYDRLRHSKCRPQSSREKITESESAPVVVFSKPKTGPELPAESSEKIPPPSPFDESLDLAQRMKLLNELSKSDDPFAIREIAAGIDVPFLFKGEKPISDQMLLGSSEPFRSRSALRRKGVKAVPAILAELADPSPSKSKWLNDPAEKPLSLLRILTDIISLSEAEKALNDLHEGPGKTRALEIFYNIKKMKQESP